MNDFDLFMYEGPLKRCLCCRADLPLESFGTKTTAVDGLNCYCKPCIREKVYTRRARLKMVQIPRKPMQVAQMVSNNPKAEVLKAVRRGCGDRVALQMATGIKWDELTDILAELAFDEGRLKFNRATRKFEIAA